MNPSVSFMVAVRSPERNVRPRSQSSENRRGLIFAVLGLFVAALITYSIQLFNQPPIKKTINANFNVVINDPHLRKLTNAVSEVDLVATGLFNEGSYLVSKNLISIPEKTSFRLSLSLPISDPNLITTRNAVGFLWTSQPIRINGAVIPQRIMIRKGLLSAEMDLAQSLAAFLFNSVQIDPGGELGAVVDKIHIEQARLNLRDNAVLSVDRKVLRVRQGSAISVTNLHIDEKFDYAGKCVATLRFAPACAWIGEKVDCRFDGGHGRIGLNIRKQGGLIELSKDPSAPVSQRLSLQNCVFSFGKNKRSKSRSNQCIMSIKEFNWKHVIGQRNAFMHFVGNMNFLGSLLDLRTDIHRTIANFPGLVPCQLTVDINKNGRETHFSTIGNVIASDGRITVEKQDSLLNMDLGKTVLGPVEFDRFGALHFRLKKGKSDFKRLEWTNSKHNLSVTAQDGESQFILPTDMFVDKEQEHEKTRLRMPLVLDIANAQLQFDKTHAFVRNLKGSLFADVGPSIKLASRMNLTLPNWNFLDGHQANISVGQLQFESGDSDSQISLENCSVTIPSRALTAAICKKLPSKMNFDLDKKLSRQKRWRYKNAIADRLEVTNLTVRDIDYLRDNRLKFSASADMNVTGTVEKGSLLAILNKSAKPHWETRPWRVAGHVLGQGLISYKTSSQNKKGLDYHIEMKLPAPDDIELDWSKVSSGFIGRIEDRIIERDLKERDFPISHSGFLPLFKASDNILLQEQNVTNVAIHTNAGGAKVTFSARAKLDQ